MWSVWNKKHDIGSRAKSKKKKIVLHDKYVINASPTFMLCLRVCYRMIRHFECASNFDQQRNETKKKNITQNRHFFVRISNAPIYIIRYAYLLLLLSFVYCMRSLRLVKYIQENSHPYNTYLINKESKIDLLLLKASIYQRTTTITTNQNRREKKKTRALAYTYQMKQKRIKMRMEGTAKKK